MKPTINIQPVLGSIPGTPPTAEPNATKPKTFFRSGSVVLLTSSAIKAH